jgi:hypothetical protein
MKRLNTSEFISKARKIHGNKYDYTPVNYNGAIHKIEIRCTQHGIFAQYPFDHLKGKGCPYCGGTSKLTREEFCKKAAQRHGNRFDYSDVNYKNAHTRITIKCPLHGIFHQTPNSHLKGRGCKQCGIISRTNIRRSNTEVFISICNKIYKGKYNYFNINYVNSRHPIEVTCPKHGIFRVRPYNHIGKNRRGCPRCSKRVSKQEIEFLDFIGISERQKFVGKFQVDGIRKNKVYEFLGDYWHGNPNKYISTDINQISKKSYGTLYENTMKKFIELKARGYDIYYIWESDWNRWKRDESLSFPIKKYQNGNKQSGLNTVAG